MLVKALRSILVAVAAAALPLLIVAAPANADLAKPALVTGAHASSSADAPASTMATVERCNVSLPYNDVCVNKTDGRVFGVIYGSAISDLTQTVRQCDGLGHNCGVIIASHSNPTSSKPVSFGHVYQNCASFTDAAGIRRTNICSPFVTA